MPPSESPDETGLTDFVDAFLDDLRVDRVGALADYRRRFPGLGDALAREYERLTGGTNLLPGATRWGYRIAEEVGRGGFGVVYRAVDERLGRTVALKVMTRTREAQAVELLRFQREATLASRLQHASFCTVHEARVEGGVAFLAMEYLDGETLAQRFAQRSAALPSRDEVLDWVRLIEDAARALELAHVQGIAHRDVKPSNLMLTRDGRLVILDFGLARDLRDEAIAISASGDQIGTPFAMSPEQTRGQRSDHRADVWALGVVLYEAVTASRPFDGATRDEVVQSIQTREPRAASRANPAVSRDLSAVLEVALEKLVERRYTSAAALADDLRSARELRGVSVKPLSPAGRLVRWARREPAVAAASVLAAALLVGGGFALSRLGELNEKRARLARLDRTTRAASKTWLGFAAAAVGEKEPAQEAFREALALAPDSLEARVGWLLALNDASPTRYLELLRAEVAVHPEIERITAPLEAWLLRQTGDATAAERAAGLADYDSGLACYVRALLIERSEDNPAPEHHAEALSWIDRGLRAPDEDHVLYYVMRAQIAAHAGAEEAARETADLLQSRFADTPRAFYFAGFALAPFDVNAATVALRRAIAREPTYLRAHRTLTSVLRRAERWEEALSVYDELLTVAPADGVALSRRGEVLLALDRTAEGLDCCREGARLAPSEPITWLLLGRALERSGAKKEALEAYTGILAATDEDATLLLEAAQHVHALGGLRPTVPLLRRAVSLAPDHAQAQGMLAVALLAIGEPDESAAAAERALTLEPTLPFLVATLTDALMERERFEEAARWARIGIESATAGQGAREHCRNSLDFVEAELALIAGQAVEPDSAYGVALHWQRRDLHARAARGYAAALAPEPRRRWVKWQRATDAWRIEALSDATLMALRAAGHDPIEEPRWSAAAAGWIDEALALLDEAADVGRMDEEAACRQLRTWLDEADFRPLFPPSATRTREARELLEILR